MHKRVIGIFVLLFLPFFALPIGNMLAASLDISAQVNAPLPPNGELPIVQTPGDNTTQTVQNIFITGQCIVIDPTLIVVLLRDNQTIGTGPCLQDGTFRILVGLVKGVNIIYPKFMTITGQSSGFGQPLRLTLDIPDQPSDTPLKQDGATKNPATPQSEGLKLIFNYDFVSYSDTTPTQVEYQVLGGYKPYVVTINWGDGTQTTAKISSNDAQTAKHQYDTVLPPAAVIVTAVDATGQKVIQSRALFSFKKGVYIPAAAPTSTTSPLFTTPQKIWIGVGSFSILALFLNRIGTASILSRLNLSKKKFR